MNEDWYVITRPVETVERDYAGWSVADVVRDLYAYMRDRGNG